MKVSPRRWWARLLAVFTRRKLDDDFAAELAHHFDQLAQRNLAAGRSLEEARRQAGLAIGGLEQTRELHRETRGLPWLEMGGREVRNALRGLCRSPVFSVTVLVTLALCIGANLSIFSALYQLILRPLPVRDPDRLVRVMNVMDRLGSTPAKMLSSVPQWNDFQANADSFEGFTKSQGLNLTMAEDTAPERVQGMRVDTDYFRLLGVVPVLGRFPDASEQVQGKDHVVVISHQFWTTRFQSAPDVIGRKVMMGSEVWTIIGVAPPSLEALDVIIQFYKPFESLPGEENSNARYFGNVVVIGRLRPGVTRAQGETQLSALDKRYLNEQAPPDVRNVTEKWGGHVILVSINEETFTEFQRPLVLLQAAALFVWFIGCVNVTNLLLARANAKRPELVIRYALGAGRSALFVHMLCETLLLASVGGLSGAGLAWCATRTINRYIPLVLRVVAPISLEWKMVGLGFLFSAFISLLIGWLVFELIWRSDLRMAQTRSVSSSRSMRAASSSLVITQVAVALVLLVGAGLLLKSFARVTSVDLGFDADRVVEGHVAFPRGYDLPERNLAIQNRIVAGLREIPGVESVALTTGFGISHTFGGTAFVIRNQEAMTRESHPLASIDVVSADFFATMGISLLGGRRFYESESFAKGRVAIVDQTFAERYFPGQAVVGEEINFGAQPPAIGGAWTRIIGVVKRANLTGFEGRDGLPFIYLPSGGVPSRGVSFLVRTSRPASDVLRDMREKLRSIDPTLPIYAAGSLKTSVDTLLSGRRGILTLVELFAALALILAAIGLYGVISYDVSQRTREIGIRGALGATRLQIIAFFMRQGLVKATLGLLLGLGGALALTTLMRSQLFDTAAWDPMTFFGVSFLMLLIATLASWLPARRAAKVDPLTALRAE